MADHLADDSRDSDDSAPEEVTLQTSKQEVMRVISDQKKAIQSNINAIKNKRKLISDKFTEQKINKQLGDKSLDRLPMTLLEEVDIERVEEKPKSEEIIVETNKRAKKRKKSLETPSTKFDVFNTSKDLSQILIHQLNDKKSGLNFKDQMIFGKRRVKRFSISKQKSFFDKQYANRK